jgi:hypothetical protein
MVGCLVGRFVACTTNKGVGSNDGTAVGRIAGAGVGPITSLIRKSSKNTNDDGKATDLATPEKTSVTLLHLISRRHRSHCGSR